MLIALHQRANSAPPLHLISSEYSVLPTNAVRHFAALCGIEGDILRSGNLDDDDYPMRYVLSNIMAKSHSFGEILGKGSSGDRGDTYERLLTGVKSVLAD
jgi:hypothetical protein